VLAARRGDRLAALNESLGGAHATVEADVGKLADCERLVDEAFRAFGRIDTLVLNAGFGLYPRVHETTPQQTREIFATNVFGTTDCIHAAVPRMLQQQMRDGFRGQVMIVSSAAARRGVPFLGVYSATKSAQLSIAEAMRVELAPQQLAVTSVHPIMTKTDFGTTAEHLGKVVLPKEDRASKSQTFAHVARHMIAAIERPRPEVWPSRPSRFALGLSTLMPRMADRALARYRNRVESANL
jgi:short-subunit dehydrogenase